MTNVYQPNITPSACSDFVWTLNLRTHADTGYNPWDALLESDLSIIVPNTVGIFLMNWDWNCKKILVNIQFQCLDNSLLADNFVSLSTEHCSALSWSAMQHWSLYFFSIQNSNPGENRLCELIWNAEFEQRALRCRYAIIVKIASKRHHYISRSTILFFSPTVRDRMLRQTCKKAAYFLPYGPCLPTLATGNGDGL